MRRRILNILLLVCLFMLTACSDVFEEATKQVLDDQNVELPSKENGLFNEELDFLLDITNDISDMVEEESSNTTTIPATLKKVQDGDTADLVVDTDALLRVGISSNTEVITVRYLLTDCPESAHPDKAVQPYALESKNRNTELLSSGDITISFDEGDKMDKFGRYLVYIFVNGESVAETLIEEGYARVAYVQSPNTRYLSAFEAAENRAREQKLRIWSLDGYVTNRGFSD